MSEKSKKKKNDGQVYKTEEQLKQEALERAKMEELLAAKRKPKSPAEKKVENFWFHYRWLVLGGGAALLLVAFFVRDVVMRTEPDFTIILVTERYLTTEMVDEIRDAIAEVAPDRNGDGVVEVSIDNMSAFPLAMTQVPAEGEEEMAAAASPIEEGEEEGMNAIGAAGGGGDYALLMKLMTLLAASDDPIYLMDEGVYDYLTRTNEGYEVFMGLEEAIPAAQYNRLPAGETLLSELEFADYLDGLFFYLKAGRENGRDDENRQDCMDLLVRLAQD